MDLGKARDRSKVLESMALRNKITKNINGIKEDIALLKEIVEKMINIYQVHGTRQPEAASSCGDSGYRNSAKSFTYLKPLRISLRNVDPFRSISLLVNRLSTFWGVSIGLDGTPCGRVCTRLTGCAHHWKTGVNNLLKSPCRICDKPTLSYTGYCSRHAGKFHRRAERERQKNALIHSTPHA
ncbi:hypothetical protein Glove_74g166 [Diversispora epigaea]|uniref:Uncharacterized protein n=1 Tax=Diversispora epigaea TaxID=1348612 RepID=A0A397JG66_9GLOM|nr:hypothetical protein Glove_74g166 [Diversispora epigaea]